MALATSTNLDADRVSVHDLQSAGPAGCKMSVQDLQSVVRTSCRLSDDFVHGFVLYTGPRRLSFGDRLTALPISAL